jgi:hypothetical protein
VHGGPPREVRTARSQDTVLEKQLAEAEKKIKIMITQEKIVATNV